MINNKFKDTFNFLANYLNDLNKFTKNQNESSEPIDKMLEIIKLVYTKQRGMTLEYLRGELIKIKSEVSKLGNNLSDPIKISLVFAVKSLTDSLIMEVDSAIETAKKQHQEKESDKNYKGIKVKVFKSSFAEEIEKEMNSFLEKNPNIQIVNTLQNVDSGVICTTILYK
jgi:hypothetical protein